jgi:hypothetical protein
MVRRLIEAGLKSQVKEGEPSISGFELVFEWQVDRTWC